MKVIGCGNPDRGDDRAGLAVSERLRDLGFSTETHTGDPMLLLERWSATDDVILIDATSSGASIGTIRVWDHELPEEQGSNAVSSHGFDLSKVIALARSLSLLPARLRVYGIEGRHFEQGAKLSPEVRQAVEQVVQRIATKLRESPMSNSD